MHSKVVSLQTDISQLQTWLISLPRAQKRRDTMLERLKILQIPYNLFDGVDGASREEELLATVNQKEFIRNMGRKILIGGMGSYHSHLGVWKQFLTTQAKFALVIEDDVVFHEDFVAAIHLALASSKHWDLLKLNCIRAKIPISQGRIGHYKLNSYLGPNTGTGAYLINRETAAKLLPAMLPITRATDHEINRFFVHKFRLRGLEPFPSHPDDENFSLITGNNFSDVVKLPFTCRLPYYQLKATNYARRLLWMIKRKEIPGHNKYLTDLAGKIFIELKKITRHKNQINTSHILVSYPKSGRTWIRFALSKFNISLLATHAGTATNWRYIGRTYADIAPQLMQAPLVFLHRDPIDTAVSMYYQVHQRDLRRWSRRWLRMVIPLAIRRALPPLDINKFVLHPCYGVPRICKFNRAWLNHLESRHDNLIITYESLKVDPDAAFQSILDFYQVSHITGKQLADASTFENMKRAESLGNSSGILRNRQRNQSDQSASKVRKGIVGGYATELSSQAISQCHIIMKEYGFEPLLKVPPA